MGARPAAPFTIRSVGIEAIATPPDFAFDRDALRSIAERERDAYRSAQPFPHMVVDDLFPGRVLDSALSEFPQPGQVDWWAFDDERERKLASRDDRVFGLVTRNLLRELNSAAFIDFLTDLTGIQGLVPDPHYYGGGLHQIEPGGFLKVHADFNRHPITKLERRLNLLVYLNRDWRDEYGGALELWDEDMTGCQVSILPAFGTCVLFNTTSRAFHGHPEPLRCPDGMTRRSLALYYYSKGRPEEAASERWHNTLFKARPGEAFDADNGEPEPRQGIRHRAGRLAHEVTPPVVYRWTRSARRRLRRG
jgi:hypothetical protein